MNNIFAKNRNKAREHFAPGLIYFAFDRENGDRRRLHLRVDKDYTAVFWLNAFESWYLNESAALLFWCILKELPEHDALEEMKLFFGKVTPGMRKDYRQFRELIGGMMDGSKDSCDLCHSGISRRVPFSKEPSAPYRVDLAMTYACNNRCAHCYNEKDRINVPFGSEEWKQVLDVVKEVGIPHVIFTGGEPTLVPFLPEVIAYAEGLGIVTGMNTNGRRLKDPIFVKALKDAGLDHIQVTLESADPAVHDRMVGISGAWEETVAGIRTAVDGGIHTTTNTTLLRENASIEAIYALFDLLHDLKTPTVGLNALIYTGKGKDVGSGLAEEELPLLLNTAREAAIRTGQRLLWYTPTQYCRFDPVANEMGIKHCTAAKYSMCVEPNGDVLPCQSWYTPVGNILKDPWETIWNAPLCTDIRSGKFRPSACTECELVDLCGGGCPLAAPYKQEIFPKTGLPACF